MVEALRDALLERHELIGDEILEVIRGRNPWPPGGAAPHPVRPAAAAPGAGRPVHPADAADSDGHGRTRSHRRGRAGRAQPCSAQLLHRPRNTTSSESMVMP